MPWCFLFSNPAPGGQCCKCHVFQSYSEGHHLIGLSELGEAQSTAYTDAEANGDVKTNEEELQYEIYCDICKDGGVKADCYCVKCDKRLCSHHEQVMCRC